MKLEIHLVVSMSTWVAIILPRLSKIQPLINSSNEEADQIKELAFDNKRLVD